MQTTVRSNKGETEVVFWYHGELKTENARGWVASKDLKVLFENLWLHQGQRKDDVFQIAHSSLKGGE